MSAFCTLYLLKHAKIDFLGGQVGILSLYARTVGGKHPFPCRQHGLQAFAHRQPAADAHEVVVYWIETILGWGAHDGSLQGSLAAANDWEVLGVHLPQTQWDGQLLFLALRPARCQAQLGLCGRP